MATNPPQVDIDALDGRGHGLRATFVRRGDRYEHAISAVNAGQATPLLVAEELPLQEAVDHRDGSRRVILLTGAGGGVYWSASVCIEQATLEVTVACRGGGSRGAVLYELAPGVTAVETSSGIAVRPGDRGRTYWIRAASMPAAHDADRNLTCQTSLEGSRITIAPRGSASGTTRQWRYKIVSDE